MYESNSNKITNSKLKLLLQISGVTYLSYVLFTIIFGISYCVNFITKPIFVVECIKNTSLIFAFSYSKMNSPFEELNFLDIKNKCLRYYCYIKSIINIVCICVLLSDYSDYMGRIFLAQDFLYFIVLGVMIIYHRYS